MRLRRKAFTLVELLVAIGIMVILAALALAFSPKTESRLAAQGADQLQTYIASARARAMRDNVLSGIRLIPDGNNNFSEFQFIQAPEPFVPGGTVTIQAGAMTATFNGNLSLAGSVQQGDLLEIMYGIGSVSRLSANPSANSATLLSTPPAAAVSALNNYPSYRFIREPRPLMGETTLQMPLNVRVNNTSATVNGTTYSAPNSTPSQLNVTSFQGATDIIFSPSGQVVNATSGRIVLWVDDGLGNTAVSSSISPPTLLCIYARTGGVAAHPVNTDTSLGGVYFFTQDGKSSGQ